MRKLSRELSEPYIALLYVQILLLVDNAAQKLQLLHPQPVYP